MNFLTKLSGYLIHSKKAPTSIQNKHTKKFNFKRRKPQGATPADGHGKMYFSHDFVFSQETVTTT